MGVYYYIINRSKHGPIEYVFTYMYGRIPIIAFLEAKQSLELSVLPQVVGELLCSLAVNYQASAPNGKIVKVITGL